MTKNGANYKLTKAEKYLINDLYILIISSASDPVEMMKNLSKTLREFIGAEEIVLFECTRGLEASCTMISQVHKNEVHVEDYLRMAEELHTEEHDIIQFDLSDEGIYSELLGAIGFDDVMIVPILAGDRKIGCMHVYGSLDRSIQDQLERLMNSIRPLIGVVLQNYQLFNNMDRLLKERMADLISAEQQVDFMNKYDQLTGLYNRGMFYNILDSHRLEQKPLGVLLVDMNGLKLLNETLGFEKGDRYLKLLAESCKRVLPVDGDLSRVGDDEIAFILPDAGPEMMTEIIEHLGKEVDRLNRASLKKFPLSISHGYYIDEKGEHDHEYIFTMAEKNLNQDKLLHAESKKSAIVRTLAKAMEARDFITEGHADRMEDLLEVFGKKMQVDNAMAVRLRLFGKFHDIGKVGIADSILFKPGRLTDEEMDEMKKHSEIGYRIALTAADLHSVADLILKHHERYDGNGYPIGLAGDEIPLECRILSIVDAFDAMTNDRPYRKAMPEAEAVAELERHRGGQFDPILVDFFIKKVLK